MKKNGIHIPSGCTIFSNICPIFVCTESDDVFYELFCTKKTDAIFYVSSKTICHNQ